MLSKEECREALSKARIMLEEYLWENKLNLTWEQQKEFQNALIKLEELYIEYFENSQIEWLRNCIGNEPFDLIFSSQEEVKRWVDRMTWHVKECDKLGRELDQLKSNPPLKFEELKVGMWVWDNKHKVYNCISRIYVNLYPNINAIQFKYLNETTQWGYTIEFEENRFYIKQVEE